MRLIRYFPRISSTGRKLESFDYCLLSSDYLPLANVINAPCIFIPTGADLTRLPFPKLDEFPKRPIFLKGFARRLMGRNQRNGIAACKKITSSVFPPFSDSLERLGIEKSSSKLAKTYLPLIMDLDLFSESFESEWPDYIKQLRSDSGFITFSPSRIIDEINPTRIRVGSWKNTSALVYGFKIFMEHHNQKTSLLKAPKLVFIDRTYSPDVEKIKNLVRELHLEEHVVWLSAANSLGFTRSQLRDLYSACDVVADDFGVGWFGGVALEALAFNKDVITYVPENLMVSIYGSNPFNVCKTPLEISQQLSKLYELKADGFSSSSGREWLQKVQGPDAILKRFNLLISEVNS